MSNGPPHDLLRPSARVSEALRSGRPLVALETTLVTHGFPRPEGLELAFELEEIVGAEGVVPATVGVLEGRLVVGLSADELGRLADSVDVAKLNLGNLSAGLASGDPGSTTVAATLLAAHRAGISVLATGGIGGVHRGAGETGDISADLTALSRFRVAVVCAGAKAVLDLPRTLEALETLGVPVFAHGCDSFPAFYRRESGLPVDRTFDRLGELAAAVRAHLELPIGTGLVVANPIPHEHEMPLDLYQRALERALQDLSKARLRGRAITPFLLDRLRDLTSGQSASSNKALLRGNARLAARLAVAMARS